MSAAKKWRVRFTLSAESDIHDILGFIVERDGPDVAEEILNKFIQARDSLQTMPERGRITPELRRINILTFREIQIYPYRMIYKIDKEHNYIYIYIIVDARRNVTEFLKERLLRINYLIYKTQ